MTLAIPSAPPARASGLQRIFEPARIGEMSLAGRVIVYAVLIVWAAFVLFPIYWIVMTSLKLPIDVNSGPAYIPWVDFIPNLHAWRDLLDTSAESALADTLQPYKNSIIVAFFSTILCMLIGSMAAYALARIQYKPKFGTILLFVLLLLGTTVTVGIWGIDWRIALTAGLALFVLLARALGRRFKRRVGNGDILFWMISQRILPPVVTVVPIYMMFQSVHLLDTHIALILTYTVVNLPIVVWLMHDFFSSIPIDLEESAQLDGASRMTIFYEIVIPLARAGLAATTLLVLILAWNEYLLALFLSTSNAQTLPILVAAMNGGEKGVLWWTMCVVIVIMIVPVVLMALLLQRFIAKGILLGAVKG
ncbi:MAG: carbohydrate ABC transporter permease [Alphaproteobacteria bacterium]